MDFIKNQLGQDGSQNTNQESQPPQATNDSSGSSSQQQKEGGIGGFLGGLKNKANAAAGGGLESEKDEDLLDKGVDWVQERMGQGPQDNESAMEQAKDEQISDYIRSQYKNTTGSDFPIKDKPTRTGL